MIEFKEKTYVKYWQDGFHRLGVPLALMVITVFLTLQSTSSSQDAPQRYCRSVPDHSDKANIAIKRVPQVDCFNSAHKSYVYITL